MIRVLVADDQELVRAGLRMILEAQPDIEVVADVGDGRTAVREAMHLRPDVALLDIQMPGGDGIAAAREILANPRLATRVVMLTTFDLDEYLYAAMAAGASGFLLKSSPRAHLLHAIRTATSGDALLDPGLTRRLIETYVRRAPASSDATAALTGRERDVLIELIRGRSNAEIAGRLRLAETTVKTHVAAILRKLGLRDRLQAVIYGYEHGLVRPGDLT
ncbi:response regulator transcription factor [Planosporangium thailandense]|uniref:Response regulator transcription factor n=1 Tax=Planosporangium thailandense TaxID=765197 RepID=A0ABX0Y964_9ACTN|nr:response regulator transcription factor [Planosporangium thailandense]